MVVLGAGKGIKPVTAEEARRGGKGKELVVRRRSIMMWEREREREGERQTEQEERGKGRSRF